MPDVDWNKTTAYYNLKSSQISSNVSRTDWLGFMDAMGWTETQDGNYCGLGGYNNAYVGIYQIGDQQFSYMNFFNGLGKKLFGITSKEGLINNPIAQELAGLMEFSGTPDDFGKSFDSRYDSVKGAAKDLGYINVYNNFDKLVGKTFSINYTDANGQTVGTDIITLTAAGISAGAHLVGQGRMAQALNEIFSDCFTIDAQGNVTQTSSTANLPTTGYGDGAGVAFSTYVKLMQGFDISSLLSASTFTDFNELAKELITYRKDKIVNYLVTKNQDVAMYNTTDCSETVKSILQGLSLPIDNLNTVDGQVVLAGAASNTKYTDKADLIFGLGNASNTLDGGAGADIMLGGKGDDKYKVDNTDDKIIEYDGEGTDLVESTATYTLPDYVENLTLMGTDNINGTGNDLPNDIKGNTGNNKLDGGGKDTLLITLAKTIYKGKRRRF